MRKIRIIDFTRLKNNEHAQFHQSIKVEIENETAAKLGIVKFYPAYKDALEAELKAIDIEKGSKFTQTVKDGSVYHARSR